MSTNSEVVKVESVKWLIEIGNNVPESVMESSWEVGVWAWLGNML
jgi:hypothetical protein